MPARQRSFTNRDETNDRLPQQLQSAAPACAQSCISSYISRQFSCAEDDFSCLCSHYSSRGYALGELAYLCLASDCQCTTQKEGLALYDICYGQKGAVQATHTVLTLPAATPSTASELAARSGCPASTTPTANSSPAPSSALTQTSAIAMSPTATAASTGSSTSAQSAGVSPASTSANGSKAADATNLTSAQAVGISIAAFGGMALIIGAIFLCSWFRRRRVTKAEMKEKRHSYDFVDDAPPRFSPFNYRFADPRGPLGGFHMPRVELDNDRGRTQWPRQTQINVPPAAVEKGDDRISGMRSISPESIQSAGSARTLSQLLPEKPGKSPPMPSRNQSRRSRNQSPRPTSICSPATVFEEEPMVFSASVAESSVMPRIPKSALMMSLQSLEHGQYSSHTSHSPGPIRQLPLSLQIPKQPSRLERISSPKPFPPPPPPPLEINENIGLAMGSRPTSSNSRVVSTNSLQTRKSRASLIPDYYTSVDSGTPVLSSPTPIDEDVQFRRAASISITKPTYPPAKAVRESAGSDTSFESTDPDEPTPPSDEEGNKLSPVAESPINGVKYPKVPRSSNQSIPRSPKPRPSPKHHQTGFTIPPQPTRHDQPIIARKPVKQPKLITRMHRQPDVNPVTPERPRSPSSPLRLSGTTLAAKRRGDSAAKDLEWGINLDAAHYHSQNGRSENSAGSQRKQSGHSARTGSPLRGYSRVASGGAARRPSYAGTGYLSPETTTPIPQFAGRQVANGTHEVTLRSPLWEPKLTPSRRGDDLFLNVSMATPDATPVESNSGWKGR